MIKAVNIYYLLSSIILKTTSEHDLYTELDLLILCRLYYMYGMGLFTMLPE